MLKAPLVQLKIDFNFFRTNSYIQKFPYLWFYNRKTRLQYNMFPSKICVSWRKYEQGRLNLNENPVKIEKSTLGNM